jgi:hypothetical protein
MLLGLISAALLAGAPDLTDGAALARAVALEYAAQTQGAVTFVVSTVNEVPAVHRTDTSEAAYVDFNGSPVHKRYLKNVAGSKPSNAAELAKLSSEPEGALSRFGMKMPIAAAFLGDFRFGKPREFGDMIAVDFATEIKDASHGDGTFFVRKNGQLDHVLFVPSVQPEHATGMTIQIDYGTVAPDRWDVVRIARTFIGHRGMLSGRVNSTSMYEQYRVHPSEAAAIASVEALTPR